MRLFCRIIFFYRVNFFLTELDFLKGAANIYFKQIALFGKKRFCKNHTYFFLKNVIFFQLSFAAFEQPYPAASCFSVLIIAIQEVLFFHA